MCEFCKTTLDLDGETIIPDYEKQLIQTDITGVNVEVAIFKDYISASILYKSNTLMGSETWTPLEEDADCFRRKINYCPMCGRTLRDELVPYKEVGDGN